MTQIQEHELDEVSTTDELVFETSQEQRDYERMTANKDRGLISYAYYHQFLYETGRLNKKPVAPPAQELSLQELSLTAPVAPPEAVREAAKSVRTSGGNDGNDGQTPKPKRLRRQTCTPKLSVVHQRIKAGLYACPKHVNGHETPFYN